MKFRKRVKIFPGFELRFSGSGNTANGGGAGIHISRRQAYSNTINTLGSVEYKSAPPEQLSSASFSELRDLLNEAYNDRGELLKEIEETRSGLRLSEFIHVVSCVLVIGFLTRHFKKVRDEKRDYLADLEKQQSNAHVKIDVYFDTAFEKKYHSVVESYKTLLTSRMIWDITSSAEHDRKATRSAASHVVERLPVTFKLNNIDIIHSSYQALHFENKNGGDLYIYPGFVIITGNARSFAVLDLKDLEIDLLQQHFIETEAVPSDTEVIDKTWAKVNKNGTPDKRFKDNYQIPVVRYAQLNVMSATGLNEVYAVSNYASAERFVTALNDYQQLLKN